MEQAEFKTQEVKGPAVESASQSPQSFGDSPPPQKSFYQSNKFYIWAIVLSAAVIAILAFFAFRPAPPKKLQEANVQIEILAPETLPSGNEAVYRIIVRNNDSVKLTDLELELAYPEGFSFVESSPKAVNLSGSVFKVPDLSSGQNVTVIVKTKTSGEINAQKKLLAKLHYKYSNFNSGFLKEAAHILRLTASDVVLEIGGPKETNSAQLVVYSIAYKNDSKDVIKNARVKAVYPAGFSYGSAQPPASLGGNIWNVGDLQSGSEGKITFQGSFTQSQPGESKKISVEFLVLGVSGEYFVQNTAEIATAIISQPLLVSLESLDRPDTYVVQPGETLNFAVRYQNNAPTAATGVNIAATLDSKALDLSSIQAQGGQVVGNIISWNAAGVPNLEILNPGESGILNFYVRVNNPATKDSSKNLKVSLVSKIKANEYSTFLPGGSVELKVASPAQIQTRLDYLSGSLPPKVGTQSRYKATLKLINSSNDFSSVELTAFLPEAAGTFNQASVNSSERENVQFDPSTGKLVWKVGSLPAHTGKFSPAKLLEFELTLNPASADVNTTPMLIRDISLSAKDAFTEQDINLSAENLTTASLEGQAGYANGTVVP